MSDDNKISNRIVKVRMTENQLRVIVGALGLTSNQNPEIVTHGCAGGILDPYDDYLDHCEPKQLVAMIEAHTKFDSYEIDLMPER